MRAYPNNLLTVEQKKAQAAKVRSSIKNYGKNVVGGAVKRAANKIF